MEVVASYDDAHLKNLRLRSELTQAGAVAKPPISRVEIPAKNLMKVVFPKIEGLKVGNYVATTVLLDSKGAIVDNTETIIRKLPPPDAGNEVICDEHNRFLLNGKPFFPIGAIMDNPQTMMRFCSKSWNTVKCTGYGITSPTSKWFGIYPKHLRAINATGRLSYLSMKNLIKKWADPTARAACRMAVEKFRKSPALFAWYLEDEINSYCLDDREEYLKTWRRVVEDFKTWDPYHPVVTTISPNLGLGERDLALFSKAPDVNGVDIYPIPFKRSGEKLSKIPRCLKILDEANQGAKPMIFVPQIAGWRSYREPSFEEMRCMFLGAVAAGAKGLLAYAVQYPWWTDKNGAKDMYMTRRGVDNCNRAADCLAKLADVLNGLDSPVKSNSEDVAAVIKTTRAGRYLLVVNMSYKQVRTTLSSKILKELSKTLPKGESTFDIELRPLECAVYKLGDGLFKRIEITAPAKSEISWNAKILGDRNGTVSVGKSGYDSSVYAISAKTDRSWAFIVKEIPLTQGNRKKITLKFKLKGTGNVRFGFCEDCHWGENGAGKKSVFQTVKATPEWSEHAVSAPLNVKRLSLEAFIGLDYRNPNSSVEIKNITTKEDEELGVPKPQQKCVSRKKGKSF